MSREERETPCEGPRGGPIKNPVSGLNSITHTEPPSETFLRACEVIRDELRRRGQQYIVIDVDDDNPLAHSLFLQGRSCVKPNNNDNNTGAKSKRRCIGEDFEDAFGYDFGDDWARRQRRALPVAPQPAPPQPVPSQQTGPAGRRIRVPEGPRKPVDVEMSGTDTGGDKTQSAQKHCVGCGSDKHDLWKCLRAGPDGLMKGCPACNTLDHNLANCDKYKKMSDKDKCHSMVMKRRNMPTFVDLNVWVELARKVKTTAQLNKACFPWSVGYTKSLSAAFIHEAQHRMDTKGLFPCGSYKLPVDERMKTWDQVRRAVHRQRGARQPTQDESERMEVDATKTSQDALTGAEGAETALDAMAAADVPIQQEESEDSSARLALLDSINKRLGSFVYDGTGYLEIGEDLSDSESDEEDEEDEESGDEAGDKGKVVQRGHSTDIHG